MAEAATRPGISGRRDGARPDEGGLWPTAPLVRRGLGQREPAVAAAQRPPQAACAPRCCTGRPGGGPGVGLGWGRALDRRGAPAMPFKANQERRHRIPKQRHRVTNWAVYDTGLRARGSLTVWFTPEAIEAWRAEPRIGRGGQPRYSSLAITTALTPRAVFRLALRQTEGLIGSVLQLLGLDLPVPDHSTLSRRATTLEVPRPKAGSAPVHLLVDGTGLKFCGPGEWLIEKHGTKRRRAWRKLHLATDADTGHIVASVLI